jgi:diguanylate cyclase (GGDEF)-like protein/PAS domain S-box-containing protein
MSLDYYQYKLIVESSPNMIWRAGTDAKCNYFNKTWLKFTGCTIEQEMGDGWAEGVHPDDLDRCLAFYLEAFGQRKPFEMEYRLRRFDGEYRWINDRGVPYHDNEGVFLGYIGSCMDVTEKIEGRRLRKQAERDGLCNIYNRHFSENLLEREFEHACQHAAVLSVIMLDIDNFKSVNDRYGHQGGDEVLRQVATIIMKMVRDIDIVGRYGGEEFIVGIVATGLCEAIEIAERIRQAIADHSFYIGQNGGDPCIQITASFGVGSMRERDLLTDLIRRADQGLYLAKASGKDCVKTV